MFLFLYLKSLDQNKDVVHTNSQNQERYDLNDNESGRYPTVAEETQGRGDGQQYDQHTGQTQGDLSIHLCTDSREYQM